MSIMGVDDDGRITDEWSMFDKRQALDELGLLSSASMSDAAQ